MNLFIGFLLGKNDLPKTTLSLLVIFFSLQTSGCAYLSGDKNEPFINPFAQSNKDLSYGMQMNTVRNIWGDPSQKETPLSGSKTNPKMGHERWIYKNNLSFLSSSETRIIYFENGRVVGWETY